VCAVLLASGLCFGQAGKVEKIGSMTDSAVSEAVRKALEPAGYKVTLADGNVACEIWLSQSVPSNGKKENTQGALYPQLNESTFVGVISFPQSATDYRGQAIKPGAYTMRYELLPDNGDHLGVAPNPDFVLAIPAAADADPGATYNFDQLVALSRQTTGTRHPAPLSLVQGAGGAAPSVAKDDQDHSIFSTSLKLSSGENLPFGLVVKGTAPQ
jgi:hypothetical protein